MYFYIIHQYLIKLSLFYHISEFFLVPSMQQFHRAFPVRCLVYFFDIWFHFASPCYKNIQRILQSEHPSSPSVNHQLYVSVSRYLVFIDIFVEIWTSEPKNYILIFLRVELNLNSSSNTYLDIVRELLQWKGIIWLESIRESYLWFRWLGRSRIH